MPGTKRLFLACHVRPGRRKTVGKQYLALAVGVPAQQRFTVDAPIDRDEDDV
jgi:23S rRNA-/tRNA-specific pseudouridylate synthase